MNPLRLLLIFTIAFATFQAGTSQSADIPEDINQLLTKNMCNTCHKLDEKLIGPSYIELAKKNSNPKDITKLIQEPQPSNWPDYPPMAPMPFLDAKEVKVMAEWIGSLGS